VKLHPQDAEAVRIVRLIDELFAIDAEARMANQGHAARHVLRSKKAPPLLEKIKAAVTAARATSLPASALAKAANYTLALWPKLTRFREYPELELSNNLAENSMRPVALGLKVAAILSVVETCRPTNIPVREYLAPVLPGLAETPIPRLPQLTPIAWASQTANLHSRCQPWFCYDAYIRRLNSLIFKILATFVSFEGRFPWGLRGSIQR
jgi:transposase